MGLLLIVPAGILIALSAQAVTPTPPAPSSASSASPQRIARFGFYPIRLYDLSPQGGVFSADFYFWLSLAKTPAGVPAGNTNPTTAPAPNAVAAPRLEASNGEELKCEVIEYDPPTSPNTQTFWYRCRSRFYHSFDFRLYPFDEQLLAIRLESPEYSKVDFSFEVMIPASHGESTPAGLVLSTAVYPQVSGWRVSWAAVKAGVNTYHTDWGFPSYPYLNEYSQAVLEFRLLHRWGIPLVALLGPNLLVGLLATLLAGSKQERSGRMQALLGVIAAAAAQHYGFMSNAPGNSILSFAQLYFIISYALLALTAWFILTRDQPLPTRYQWRWFLGYMALLGICLTVHRWLVVILHH